MSTPSTPTPPTEPLDGHVRRIVSLFDEKRLEAWREREAIMAEGNPGLDRLTCERLATLDIVANYGLPCPVQLLQVEMAGGTQWVLTCDVVAVSSEFQAEGVQHILPVPLADTVRGQFADAAYLTTCPT